MGRLVCRCRQEYCTQWRQLLITQRRYETWNSIDDEQFVPINSGGKEGLSCDRVGIEVTRRTLHPAEPLDQ
jgi:hypothetical protein